MTQRMTLYDVLDQKGYFSSNPANVQARDPDGRSLYVKQLFPQMVYHPEGQTRQIQKPEIIATLLGPQAVGEKRELISLIVNNEEELAKALADGWHLRPSLSAAAAGEDVQVEPPSDSDKLAAAEAELMQLRAKLAELE